MNQVTRLYSPSGRGPDTVELRFKSIYRNVLAMVVDPRTGEVVMAEALPAVAVWLERLGYQWSPDGGWVRQPRANQ